ncbi:Splicing factor 3B subunit 3, partial [Fragariocoptes setiger]
MHLYNITLRSATAITHAILGEFSGRKGPNNRRQYEIVISKGRLIELIRPDVQTGELFSVLSVDIFGTIRSMSTFRLAGGSKDYIVIGSDSGRLTILEYSPTKNIFEIVYNETYGRSGTRRIVPGQYVACDPRGRAVMIGAVEKEKRVYILNRDTQARLTLSSPLDAHKANTIVYYIVGIDVAYENPMFACLELDYEEANEDLTGKAASETRQTLTFYELDLGLYHVVRKYSEPLEKNANMLIAVPGGDNGPSGILVCSENFITYKNFGEQKDITCPIPRRKGHSDNPDIGTLIVSSATHKIAKRGFFFLVQTDDGDVFKLDLETNSSQTIVTEMKLKYFDTIATSNSLCFLPGGFLFAAAEFGNHALYQVINLGDDADKEHSSKEYEAIRDLGDDVLDVDTKKFRFMPRTDLINLNFLDEIESLAPIMTSQVTNVANEDTPQIVTACGRGSRSSIRILRHGLRVTEAASIELEGNPTAVWAIKKRIDADHDGYIIVSFINATVVLGFVEVVQDGVVKEEVGPVDDSGFLTTKPTLGCGQIGDSDLVQIHPEGIRHIRSGLRVNEWRTPGKRQIVKCAVNQRQVAIALSNGEITYFEMDVTGQLSELNERKEMSTNVTCMALGQVPLGEQRFRFLAVGLADSTMRIISLDPGTGLSQVAIQALPSTPESVCLVEMGGNRELGTAEQLYLNIGLQNGVLFRTVLDQNTGEMSVTRTRYLGSRPVQLFNVTVQSNQALFAATDRSWLSYYHHSKFHLVPLKYERLEHVSCFSSNDVPEGIVAVTENTLRVLVLDQLGVVFNQQCFPLQATPRKFVVHPQSRNIITIEVDRLPVLSSEGSDRWRSLLRILDPLTGLSHQEVLFDSEECLTSLALSTFSKGFTSVIVGVAKGLKIKGRNHNDCYINSYRLAQDGNSLEFMHSTPVESVPQAMCTFQSLIAIGIGKTVRIYDMGQKKLLTKCENRQITNFVVSISAHGSRLMVADAQDGFTFMKYTRAGNSSLTVFADDVDQRFVVSAGVIDHSTVAAGDKFGNLSIIRLHHDVNDDVDDDPTGTRSLWDRGWLGGSSQKSESIVNFHVGDIITSIQKVSLAPGFLECIVYTTIMGAIGALIPLTNREDIDFFQKLESSMRTDHMPLCGRDHVKYRSFLFPVKNVIDGDLCDLYTSLDSSVQQRVANELDMATADICLLIDQVVERIL